jgi:esterase/lipase superfamily enzyme
MSAAPGASRPQSWVLACLLAYLLSACAGYSGEPALAELDIPFLTTRHYTTDSDGDIAYSTDTGELSAGLCNVTLHQGEEIEAENGPVSAQPLEDTLDRFGSRSEPGLLIYIHGYNIGVNRACRDAARLAWATGFEDRLLLFSWPASRALVTYRRDERRLAESTPAILAAIDALAARHGRQNINIVTHSMGSRVVLAMAGRAQDGDSTGDARIDDLILVAPDIDRQAFLDAAPALQHQVRNLSVLVSEDDKLLLLSELVNQNERLGQDSDFALPGIRVVDVSEFEGLGLTGHIYHLENDRVGELLRYILNADNDAPTPRR